MPDIQHLHLEDALEDSPQVGQTIILISINLI